MGLELVTANSSAVFLEVGRGSRVLAGVSANAVAGSTEQCASLL